jgi:hypothetical protein
MPQGYRPIKVSESFIAALEALRTRRRSGAKAETLLHPGARDQRTDHRTHRGVWGRAEGTNG